MTHHRYELETKTRTEQEIFDDLESVCTSPGFLHALAYLCFRDNTILYSEGKMSVDDVQQQFSMDRLIRTEISTLIGLACKGSLDIDLPPATVVQQYIDSADSLLGEIHGSMMKPLMDSFDPTAVQNEHSNPFLMGHMLRESIFYGGEGAYQFQYRDMSLEKYAKDDEWFSANKGYSVEQAVSVVSAIGRVQNEKINDLMSEMAKLQPQEWTFLPAFIVTVDEAVSESGVNAVATKAIIESFVAPQEIQKSDFSALDDFNPTNAYPVIKLNDTEYLLLQNYSLVEALYETPFFWFYDDPSYRSLAKENRGAFTEEFADKRLKLVFGESRVFKNVEIYKNKKTRVGEIDVLVIFANRAIVLQAKSKKLTIAARKGNDNCLKDDFKMAVQDAYDQSASCAKYLNDPKYRLIDSQGNQLDIPRKYKEIYPFCLVSDHYPALSFQARQFLKYEESDPISPPFVLDVFLLDVMTEMLQSPLYFLNYISRRVRYLQEILSSHELTVLSYHLKYNLWVDSKYSLMQLGDDICADLDLAMLTRRDNAPGVRTPEGILTKYKNTPFGKIIDDIDHLDHPGTIDLGFMMLELSGDTIERINDGIAKLTALHKKDGDHHDFTIGIGDGAATGLTIHCNSDRLPDAGARLEHHLSKRKYAQKADSWFGICIDPISSRLKFGLNLSFDWEQSSEMDELTREMQAPQILRSKERINFKTSVRAGRKIGRNEKCPCGSGKKYKHCCMP